VNPDRIGDDQAEDDRPQYVLDVGQVGIGRRADGLEFGLGPFPGEADGDEQQDSRDVFDDREGVESTGLGNAPSATLSDMTASHQLIVGMLTLSQGMSGSSRLAASSAKTAATTMARTSAETSRRGPASVRGSDGWIGCSVPPFEAAASEDWGMGVSLF
jgi:hypothetical protein